MRKLYSIEPFRARYFVAADYCTMLARERVPNRVGGSAKETSREGADRMRFSSGPIHWVEGDAKGATSTEHSSALFRK